MGDAVEQPSIDYETYLTLEREADQKHEWLNGQIYARKWRADRRPSSPPR